MLKTSFPNSAFSYGFGSDVFTGNRFYVDSGAVNASDGNTGLRPGTPFATVDAAINACTASNGDVIYVMPGHNENLSGTDAIDVDVAGVSIIGLGTGSNMPTFDHDETASELVIGAANVTLENLRFRAGNDAVVNAINIEAAGDNFMIRNCRFANPEASTDEFVDAIIVEAGADDGVIEDNYFNAGAQAAVSCIELNGAVINILIRRNHMLGKYSTACIRGDSTLSEGVLIEDNLLWNGDPAGTIGTVAVISLLTATAGIIRNNDIVCDLATPDLSIVLGASPGMFLFGNRYQEAATPNSVRDADLVTQVPQFLENAMVTANMATNNNYETADTPVVWTVTGAVRIRCWARIVTSLTSTSTSGSMELGTSSNTALLGVLEVADGTAFQAGDYWGHSGTSLGAGVALDDFVALNNGEDVQLTFATNNMTAGKVTFYCEWLPITPGSTVVAAQLPT